MVPERIRGVDDFAGIELGQPNVSDGLGGDDVARGVVHLAAEVVGEIGVVSEVGTDLLSVDGVDDVLRMMGGRMGGVNFQLLLELIVVPRGQKGVANLKTKRQYISSAKYDIELNMMDYFSNSSNL